MSLVRRYRHTGFLKEAGHNTKIKGLKKVTQLAGLRLLTKEELAKYINTFTLIEKSKEGKKILIVGPNTVVQGSQKNHDAFIKYNLPQELPDSIWFEDAIAKTILFRAAEREYGRAPNA